MTCSSQNNQQMAAQTMEILSRWTADPTSPSLLGELSPFQHFVTSKSRGPIKAMSTSEESFTK